MTGKKPTICRQFTTIDDTILGGYGRNSAQKDDFKHISCCAGLLTTFWSYCTVSHPGTATEGGTFDYSALTITAIYNKPGQIERINDLVDEHSKYIPRVVPTYQTLYWSDPPRGLPEQKEPGNILWNNDEDDENAEVFIHSPEAMALTEPWETGCKNLIIVHPDEIARIKVWFDIAGLYVWHCHIVEYEDNIMMSPYRVRPMP